MKKFILLLFLVTQINFPQSGWRKAEGPYGGEAREIYFKGDTLLLGVNRKIYFSTNNGAWWREVDINKMVTSFTHSNDSTFFASASGKTLRSYNMRDWTTVAQFEPVIYDNKGYLHAVNVDLIFRSSNNGSTWTPHHTLPDNYFPTFLVTPTHMFVTGKGQISRKNLVNDTPWEVIPFAEYFNPITLIRDKFGRIYGVSSYNKLIAYSPDDGMTWSYLDLTPSLPNVKPNNIAFENETLIISNSIWDDRTGALLYRSTDYGSTWETADYGLPPMVPVLNLRSNNGYFYACTFGGGLFKSTDQGHSWQALNTGINELEIRKIIITEDNTFYAATYGRGILRSSNMGQSWKEFNEGIKGYYAGDLVKQKGDFLIASTIDGIFTLKHGTGDSRWKKVREMLLGMDYLYVDNKDRLLINTGLDIHMSTDGGNNWQLYYNAFDVGGILQTGNRTIFITQMNGKRIQRSTNDGQSWNTVFTYDHALYNPIMDEEGNILIPGKYIAKSVDNGLTWNIKQSGILNPHTLTVFTDMQGNYFCSSHYHTEINGNFYYSSDRGETWMAVSGKLFNTEIRDMLFLDDITFAATDRGLWYLYPPLPQINKNELVPVAQGLLQNFPNPFNPSTIIIYSIPKYSRVTVKIFDILGSEITTLINEDKAEGTYELTWNAANLPSGIYFYRIQAGEFAETKKMILMR